MNTEVSAVSDTRYRASLTDGTVVVVRRLGPDDRDAVFALHTGMPPGDRYLRFFTMSQGGGDGLADLVVSGASVAVGAFLDGGLLGIAHYRRERGEETPEVAVAVAHGVQHNGIASLLLEHLLATARAEGVTRLTASVLGINHAMLAVLRDLGVPTRATGASFDVREIVLRLPAAGTSVESERYIDAVLDRTVRSDVAGLRSLLAPDSIVIVGSGHGPDSVDQLILRHVLDGGYTGTVHLVGPRAVTAPGAQLHRRIEDLPDGIDLAVLCGPAVGVPDAAERCGARGIRGLLVIGSNVSADPVLRSALEVAVERHGTRMIGPGSVGVVNTDPTVGLHAIFGTPGTAGTVGLCTRSGGAAIALIDELDHLGLGVSTAVSTGEAIDVNVDDMLMWWAVDPSTTAVAVDVGSVGRPRQFARLARRLATAKPLVALRPVDSTPASSDVVREVLFDQAGVLRVDKLDDVSGLLALLSWQPLPHGPRVAIVSTGESAGATAADACVRAGLTVSPLPANLSAALAAVLPAGTPVANPVVIPATATPDVHEQIVDSLLASPNVDAVLAMCGSVDDRLAEMAPRHAGTAMPLVVVRIGQADPVQRIDLPQTAVPAFADAAAAARAIAAALHRSQWLHRNPTPARPPTGIRPDLVLDVVINAMAERPDGGWLTTARAGALAQALGLGAVDITAVPVGIEYLIEATSDPVWGPLLTIGPTATDAIPAGHRAHCLIPPTEHDLDHALADGTDEIRTVVGDCAARLSWLVDRFPEVADARINLLVADAQGLAVDVRVRLAPATEAEPCLPAIPE